MRTSTVPRSMRRALISFCFVMASTSLHAAGNYTQTFSSSAAGWQKSDSTHTWTVTGGYYANSQNVAKAISYYGNDTWNTNYTYSVRMWGEWGAVGNYVGVVFNLQDDSTFNNFYEVSFSSLFRDDPTDQATATLYKVIGNVRTVIGSATFPAPGSRTWFNVRITRVGTKTTVGVNGVAVLRHVEMQSELGTGRIGVIGRWNNVRFDDVNVGVATQLFSSSFGSAASVVVKAPECHGTWFQDLDGQDAATGYTWPPTFWGVPTVPVFNTTMPCGLTYEDYVSNQLKTVTGPTGTSSRVLSNTVLNIDGEVCDYETTVCARLGVGYGFGSAPSPSHYIRRYLKYPSNLMQQLPLNGFFNQHEFKTSAAVCNTGSPGRLTIQWKRNIGWSNHYRVIRDTNNNCPDNPSEINWQRYCSPTTQIPEEQGGGNCPAVVPPMPLGVWFYDEFYVHHSLVDHNPQDRVAYAINGQVVFDINLSTLDLDENTASNPPRGMKLTPGYLNVNNMEILTDDLEVYNQIPCAAFPCGPPLHH